MLLLGEDWISTKEKLIGTLLITHIIHYMSNSWHFGSLTPLKIV